jgi:hypothetical protein
MTEGSPELPKDRIINQTTGKKDPNKTVVTSRHESGEVTTEYIIHHPDGSGSVIYPESRTSKPRGLRIEQKNRILRQEKNNLLYALYQSLFLKN